MTFRDRLYLTRWNIGLDFRSWQDVLPELIRPDIDTVKKIER